MTQRYIIYDTANQLLWGDTAKFGPSEGVLEACESADRVNGDWGWKYRLAERGAKNDGDWTGSVFDVYEAPEGFPTGYYADDAAIIERVKCECEYVATVRSYGYTDPNYE